VSTIQYVYRRFIGLRQTAYYLPTALFVIFQELGSLTNGARRRVYVQVGGSNTVKTYRVLGAIPLSDGSKNHERSPKHESTLGRIGDIGNKDAVVIGPRLS
jgi:hypothetical protein